MAGLNIPGLAANNAPGQLQAGVGMTNGSLGGGAGQPMPPSSGALSNIPYNNINNM